MLFTQIIQKNETFLILQYRTLKSVVAQWLANREWHRVNRQEELLTNEGEEVGDGRAEGSSAIGETEGTLQFHSRLMLMAQVLVPSLVDSFLSSLL